MQSASTRTGEVPNLHGHVPFANFAEMEGNGGYDIFTPLRSRIHLVTPLGHAKHKQRTWPFPMTLTREVLPDAFVQTSEARHSDNRRTRLQTDYRDLRTFREEQSCMKCFKILRYSYV